MPAKATGPDLGRERGGEAEGANGRREAKAGRDRLDRQGRDLALWTDMRLLLSYGIVPRKIPPKPDFLPSVCLVLVGRCVISVGAGRQHPPPPEQLERTHCPTRVSHLLRAQSSFGETECTFSL